MSTKTNKPFQLWKVSDDEEYKLFLQGTQIAELETKLGGRNLMTYMGDGQSVMPSLRVMIMMIHGAMARYHHGIKLSDVYSMYDRYIENGGSMVGLYSDVIIPLLQVSGFFRNQQTETVTEDEDE
jgi:hypothetical protein